MVDPFPCNIRPNDFKASKIEGNMTLDENGAEILEVVSKLKAVEISALYDTNFDFEDEDVTNILKHKEDEDILKIQKILNFKETNENGNDEDSIANEEQKENESEKEDIEEDEFLQDGKHIDELDDTFDEPLERPVEFVSYVEDISKEEEQRRLQQIIHDDRQALVEQNKLIDMSQRTLLDFEADKVESENDSEDEKENDRDSFLTADDMAHIDVREHIIPIGEAARLDNELEEQKRIIEEVKEKERREREARRRERLAYAGNLGVMQEGFDNLAKKRRKANSRYSKTHLDKSFLEGLEKKENDNMEELNQENARKRIESRLLSQNQDNSRSFLDSIEIPLHVNNSSSVLSTSARSMSNSSGSNVENDLSRLSKMKKKNMKKAKTDVSFFSRDYSQESKRKNSNDANIGPIDFASLQPDSRERFAEIIIDTKQVPKL
eukprot:TRINITY_DN1367_c0_g1_i1.p1 TRINITY_DN1367_c0_g1~~TRINITY_DN1367_c0_g1_i1.p1  ORF type:complete len:446 (+),score=158.58 TRINITY_DN1367_c0_g1_i1:30-1340(+)